MNVADNDINGATALESFSITKYYSIVQKIIQDSKKIDDSENSFF